MSNSHRRYYAVKTKLRQLFSNQWNGCEAGMTKLILLRYAGTLLPLKDDIVLWADGIVGRMPMLNWDPYRDGAASSGRLLFRA